MTNLSTPSLGSIVTNALARKVIYASYGIAVFVLGGITVYIAAVGAGQPEWIVGTNAVLVYAGIPIGGLALANTPKDVPVQIEVTPTTTA